MIELSLTYFLENMGSMASHDEIRTYFTIVPETCVNYGADGDVRLAYCQENNIPNFYIHRIGGTIVFAKDAIGVAHFRPIESGSILDEYTNMLIQNLIALGLNAQSSNNDILIDGFKVASTVEIYNPEKGNQYILLSLISINLDLEIIQKVCKKYMHKIPKGLSDFGVTKELIIQVLSDYFDSMPENFSNSQ